MLHNLAEPLGELWAVPARFGSRAGHAAVEVTEDAERAGARGVEEARNGLHPTSGPPRNEEGATPRAENPPEPDTPEEGRRPTRRQRSQAARERKKQAKDARKRALELSSELDEESFRTGRPVSLSDPRAVELREEHAKLREHPGELRKYRKQHRKSVDSQFTPEAYATRIERLDQNIREAEERLPRDKLVELKNEYYHETPPEKRPEHPYHEVAELRQHHNDVTDEFARNHRNTREYRSWAERNGQPTHDQQPLPHNPAPTDGHTSAGPHPHGHPPPHPGDRLVASDHPEHDNPPPGEGKENNGNERHASGDTSENDDLAKLEADRQTRVKEAWDRMMEEQNQVQSDLDAGKITKAEAEARKDEITKRGSEEALQIGSEPKYDRLNDSGNPDAKGPKNGNGSGTHGASGTESNKHGQNKSGTGKHPAAKALGVAATVAGGAAMVGPSLGLKIPGLSSGSGSDSSKTPDTAAGKGSGDGAGSGSGNSSDSAALAAARQQLQDAQAQQKALTEQQQAQANAQQGAAQQGQQAISPATLAGAYTPIDPNSGATSGTTPSSVDNSGSSPSVTSPSPTPSVTDPTPSQAPTPAATPAAANTPSSSSMDPSLLEAMATAGKGSGAGSQGLGDGSDSSPDSSDSSGGNPYATDAATTPGTATPTAQTSTSNGTGQDAQGQSDSPYTDTDRDGIPDAEQARDPKGNLIPGQRAATANNAVPVSKTTGGSPDTPLGPSDAPKDHSNPDPAQPPDPSNTVIT